MNWPGKYLALVISRTFFFGFGVSSGCCWVWVIRSLYAFA